MPEIFFHLIQFLFDEFILQLPIEDLLGDLFPFPMVERTALSEGLLWFLSLSDLIHQFIDIPHGFDLHEHILICEIAVEEGKLRLGLGELLLEVLHLFGIAHSEVTWQLVYSVYLIELVVH